MTSILVAGLDPAFANFGIARMHLDLETLDLTLDRFTTISTESDESKMKVIRKNSDDLSRAKKLHDGVHRELKDCVLAFAEIPSGSQHARTALAFGAALGIIASVKVPIFEVMPTETKLWSVGSKTAEKSEIIAWAAERYPEAPWKRYERDTRGKQPHRKGDLHLDNEHVADAIAIVHAGINLPEFKQANAVMKATAKFAV